MNELQEDQQADFVTILSSGMIADIVEEYFNKKVYKKQVIVVDTKPTESGYMFSLAFVQRIPETQLVDLPIETKSYPYQPGHVFGNGKLTEIIKRDRDSKGHFTKKGVVTDEG